ncbi:MAG TPA: lipopolysaccharide kinase InaA family protein [Phycisphaerae bacterium]|nr:lipopolysaccharide kinase InaA family protein [Phycisphaerae bacterium]
MSTLLTIADDALRDPLRTAGLDTYVDFLHCSLGEIVHQSSTALTRRIVLPHAGVAVTLYLKSYRPGRLHGWTPSRPLRERFNYLLLRDRCAVSVPETIAFGSRRTIGRWRDGFILTRAVPRAVSLDRLVPARRDAGPLRRYLLDHTAGLVSRMHAAGFYHFDLQWRNLLVSDDGADAPEVYVIDSARGGLRHWRILREHGRLRDLSSLFKEARNRLTPREQLRWLKSYLGVRQFTPSHRALIRTIQYDRAIKDHEA